MKACASAAFFNLPVFLLGHFQARGGAIQAFTPMVLQKSVMLFNDRCVRVYVSDEPG